MKLYMKQKVFSLKGSFSIYDEEEVQRYSVEGKMFSVRSKHYVYNNLGAQVAYIHQKPIAFLPKFYIELSNGDTYEMKSKLAFAKEVSLIEKLGWEIRGDFMQHNYTITSGEREVVSVHQQWLSWGDTYEIDIKEGVDEVLALAVVLCYDIMHEETAAASSASS